MLEENQDYLILKELRTEEPIEKYQSEQASSLSFTKDIIEVHQPPKVDG